MHYSSYIALALYWSGECTIAVILHWPYWSGECTIAVILHWPYWSGECTIAVILHWLYTGVVSAL